MERRRAWEMLRMDEVDQLLAARIEDVLADMGTRERVAHVVAVHMLDACAKQIGAAVGMSPEAVGQMTRREKQRIEVPGKGTLAFMVATHEKMSADILVLWARRRRTR